MKTAYDLHIHSCLSPCGDMDMTPNNIVNMSKLMGYDIIALTDHNTCGNCEAAMKAGEAVGITVIPGMELCTSEEVHIVCLFPTLQDAKAFSDENDNIIGYEEKLLITASGISTAKAVETVAKYNGICYPAHIDRSSFSILSNLGVIDKTFGFNCVEIFDIEKADELKEKHPIINNMRVVTDSDAHYLENMRIPEKCFIHLPDHKIETMLDWLQK